MSITVGDPILLGELSRISDQVELTYPMGSVIGTLSIDGLGKMPAGKKSPFSDDELAERRKDRTGRPLADILGDLEAQQ